jgi:hypothetical protein
MFGCGGLSVAVVQYGSIMPGGFRYRALEARPRAKPDDAEKELGKYKRCKQKFKNKASHLAKLRVPEVIISRNKETGKGFPSPSRHSIFRHLLVLFAHFAEEFLP